MNKKTKNNRALIFLAVSLALAYLLPFHQNPFRAFHIDWLAIFGLVIVIAYFMEERVVTVQTPWIAMVPISLALIVAIQAGMGMLSELWDAFLPIIYFILAAIAIIVGATVTARHNGAANLCTALVTAHLVAAMISVIIATLQLVGAEIPFAPFMMLMVHEAGAPIRPHANLGQPNHLALLFCIGLACTWWLFQLGRIKTSVAIGMAVSLLWGLVVTQSRIGWIIIPLFGFVVCLWNGKVGIKPISGWLIVGLISLYAAWVTLLPELASAFGSSTSSVEARVGGSSERKALFEQAWNISLAHPWFGAGWFQFGPQQVMGTNFPPSIYAQHAHNLVLNFAAELGWPITIVICSVFGFWLFRTLFSRSIRVENAFAVLYFLAVLVHSMVEYPLWYAIVLMPFALLVGMVHQTQFETREITLSRSYLLAVVFLLASSLLTVGMDYRRVVIGFNVVEFEAMGMKWDETAKQKPVFTVFPYAFDYLRFIDMTVHEHMPPEEIAFMERVTKRFCSLMTLSRMSQVYAMNGREDEAVQAAMTIRRLFGVKYNNIYEDWRRAPAKYQNVFKRLPAPDYVPSVEASKNLQSV